MKISRQRISQASLFFFATVLLSSCNRGYGCPSNFDLGETVIEAASTLVTFLFQADFSALTTFNQNYD